ncbi:MAG TPA: oxygenase MpaB family protein [Steroidobacteraceae bacterium]|nr:oxygenase MpaB family protein [Steroidobacteraceae bacterium]
MHTSITKLSSMLASEAAQIPSMYGRVDFASTPERFTAEPGDLSELSPELAHQRPELLANEELVARIKAYTMHGDPVADAYAALIPEYGFRRLTTMLEEACDRGLENVASPPAQLVQLIRAMEQFPAWLDTKRIERGARIERNAYAHRVPFVIRGGLIGTFMNKYSALPMALTGALSSKTAGRRSKETATFFTTTVLPGGLERHGPGFKAAAMVRLMHSMVRFNLLSRGDQWDVRTYGIPIPQVDQMPVALLPVFALAQKALRRGRTTFTAAERARVDLARYRGFLLGLPQELLADTPQGVVDSMLTRFATLRKGFDDTCAGLVAATMAADLTPDHSLGSRVHAWMEHGCAKRFFVAHSMRGDKRAAAGVGVRVGMADYLGAAAATVLIASTMTAYALAAYLPVIGGCADRSLVRKLTRQLARYGHAEFRTNAQACRPVHTSD